LFIKLFSKTNYAKDSGNIESMSIFTLLITLEVVGEVLKLREKDYYGHFPNDKSTGFSIFDFN